MEPVAGTSQGIHFNFKKESYKKYYHVSNMIFITSQHN